MQDSEIKEKYQYIKNNLYLFLAPHILFFDKSTITQINYQKILKIPANLLSILTNYLIISDNKELEEYVCTLKNDKVYMKKYRDNIYNCMGKLFGYNDCWKYFVKFILDSVKKKLKKEKNEEGIIILKKYYNEIK